MSGQIQQTIEHIISPFQFRHAASFDHLPASVAEHLRSGTSETLYKKGAVIFSQGSPARGVYFLVRGKVKSYVENKGGQRRITHLYTDGDILGYCPLLANGVHTCTIETLEPCVLQFMPKDVFAAILAESPLFAQFLLKALSQEFSAWSQFQVAFDANPVRVRLALALMILHEKYRLPGNPTAVINFTRTDLADYVGASLETIVRNLREFRESGLVHVRGRRIMINDVESLIALTCANPVGTVAAGLA